MKKYPRYTIWTDETLWGKTAVESGLVYGVYDNLTDNKFHPEGVTITSAEQAREEAKKLNESLDNPYDY